MMMMKVNAMNRLITIDNIELNYAIEYSLSIPATIKCFVSDTHMQVNALL